MLRQLAAHPGFLIAALIITVGALGTWPWLFIPTTLAAAVAFALWLGKNADTWDQQQAARAAAIAARADYEHHAALTGQPQGTYGQYKPYC